MTKLIEQYRKTVSLPFEPGEYKRIGVKVIDDRGIESLKIVEIKRRSPTHCHPERYARRTLRLVLLLGFGNNKSSTKGKRKVLRA